ncbi:MAG: glucose-1-phosphate adenylyltransferase, partial [Nocardioidaceae bacterium]|nr:glucose-1-phosphate adenylyltransferase [Nocardioidaceae bacterium]
VYRMDASQMVQAHIDSGAGVSVAGIRVPRMEADQFGVIATGENGVSITDFIEKPADPPGLVDSPQESFASMGNYVFSAHVLVDALRRDAEDESSRHDMGGDIIPMLVGRGEAAVYDFKRNDVPGSTIKDRDYWRDVGTLSSYHEAHLDLVSVEPVFNLYNRDWPIFTSHVQLPGAKFVESASADDAIVCAGSIVSGAAIRSSVIGTNVYVSTGARIDRSVIMDNVRIGRGAHVVNAIIDKNVVVPDRCQIGLNPAADRAAGFTVTDEGITVLAKGHPISGTSIGTS